MERQKMELEVNKPTKIKLLFNDCIEGSTPKFGKYYLYAVQNGNGSSEYSLFAADQLHEELKKFKKDDELLVTKLAANRNGKLVVTYEVKKMNEAVEPVVTNQTNLTSSSDDFYYNMMEKSFEEALRIQNRFNGMANVNQLAVTIFISRLKQNHSFAGG
ncbi:MAG: hypothetical protein NTX65_16550 [Ignavibacteriales bacterium]|nr:hypothetical protein [Ignavibacteriales bacterium]